MISPALTLAHSAEPDTSLEERYGAHNYASLPVDLVRGEGVWLWDKRGRRYLDLMSAYSAVSHGHCHPRLVAVAREQIGKLAVTSRAFHSEWLGHFLARACELTGMARALPMNTGAEAVETAIKAARKWAAVVRGIPDGQAEILVMENNFHGRTTTIIGFSSNEHYRAGFGPVTPGFGRVPFGDLRALEKAIGPYTAAVLLEPMQGEGGINIPPPGWLAGVAALCRERGVLLLVDEIQTGLGRTGARLACDHEKVKPDGLMLGKALGGGLLPVSLFLASEELMQVFGPGDHGSTFGGNPLAARVGLEALDVLEEENLAERSRDLGAYFLEQLRTLEHAAIREVRGAGLFIGMELDPAWSSAAHFCEALLKQGALSKDTRENVVRLTPPLVISRAEIDIALQKIRAALDSLEPMSGEPSDR
ncbi:MAG: ornithine--oxo-acid transaminase [Pedobacter sp.]|nr:ornithine--oxo-acid transaminase [Pedobacter sp.]